MKSLSKHLKESLNDESKSIVDIAIGDGKSKLRLTENNPEENVVEETVTEEVENESAKNEDVVTEKATEKEKPSE